MNVVELKPPIPAELRRSLAQLPGFDPPPELWLRIARDLRPPARRFDWRIAAALLLAAGAGIAGWSMRGSSSVVPVAAAPDLAAMRDLEVALAQVRRAPQAQLQLVQLEAELHGVDQRLQSAYQNGGDAAEIRRLAQARMDLLRTLTAAYRQPAGLFRI